MAFLLKTFLIICILWSWFPESAPFRVPEKTYTYESFCQIGKPSQWMGGGGGVGSLGEKEMEQVEKRGVEMEETWEKHENTNNRELLICCVSQ